MIRVFTKQVLGTNVSKERIVRALSSNVAPSTNALPSVFDTIIKLTFIDSSGLRRVVPAMIGKTLHETGATHGIDIGPSSCGSPVNRVSSDRWLEPLYGEGSTSGYDHVVLNGPGVDEIKPMDYSEKRCLEQWWDDDELYPESRLASQVVLTKQMDGMTVFLPDRMDDAVP